MHDRVPRRTGSAILVVSWEFSARWRESDAFSRDQNALPRVQHGQRWDVAVIPREDIVVSPEQIVDSWEEIVVS
jgi:hypothetical protein